MIIKAEKDKLFQKKKNGLDYITNDRYSNVCYLPL